MNDQHTVQPKSRRGKCSHRMTFDGGHSVCRLMFLPCHMVKICPEGRELTKKAKEAKPYA